GWQHGPVPIDTGRAVSYDDDTHHAIDIWQLQTALSGQGLDAIAFDASLMQMSEVAYQLRTSAPLVVGSEESPPGEGYPYDTVFQNFASSPDLAPSLLCRGFVDGMLSDPAYVTRKITQSVLDSSKLTAVGTAASDLANTLIAHPEINSEIQAARVATQGF